MRAVALANSVRAAASFASAAATGSARAATAWRACVTVCCSSRKPGAHAVADTTEVAGAAQNLETSHPSTPATSLPSAYFGGSKSIRTAGVAAPGSVTTSSSNAVTVPAWTSSMRSWFLFVTGFQPLIAVGTPFTSTAWSLRLVTVSNARSAFGSSTSATLNVSCLAV